VLIPFSSETKQGLEELWKYVDSYVLEDEAVDETIDEMVDETKNSKTAEVEETTGSGSED
jgi:GTP-binding protein